MCAVLQAATRGGKRGPAAPAPSHPAARVIPAPLVDRVRVRNILHRMRTVRALPLPEREREWTWWTHTGGGNALAFKPPPNATR
jgi:hypothetical protein